jgi:hypothetical protein
MTTQSNFTQTQPNTNQWQNDRDRQKDRDRQTDRQNYNSVKIIYNWKKKTLSFYIHEKHFQFYIELVVVPGVDFDVTDK